MDLVLGIFGQLGADSTVFIQFGIFVIVFLAAKFLFVNRLQMVIENREEKTVKLEGSAEKQFEKINQMSSDYKTKINSANKEVKELFEEEKAKITKSFESNYREKETEINKFIEEARAEAGVEIEKKKEEVFSQAESLSNQLVQKITKG